MEGSRTIATSSRLLFSIIAYYDLDNTKPLAAEVASMRIEGKDEGITVMQKASKDSTIRL